ncbi:MAG: hypothetical protein KatS3mg009_2478 [Acidimicrobiia bacterium]|nr:MAG: hypothetical protein KatS3mg009_2478 [Acidimicrobiia bacterium]
MGEWLKAHVRDIPDHPSPGVVFKDITPLLADPDAFARSVDELAEPFDSLEIDKVLGVEARGFVFAAPVAYRHRAGFVPVRKPASCRGTSSRRSTSSSTAPTCSRSTATPCTRGSGS